MYAGTPVILAQDASGLPAQTHAGVSVQLLYFSLNSPLCQLLVNFCFIVQNDDRDESVERYESFLFMQSQKSEGSFAGILVCADIRNL